MTPKSVKFITSGLQFGALGFIKVLIYRDFMIMIVIGAPGIFVGWSS